MVVTCEAVIGVAAVLLCIAVVVVFLVLNALLVAARRYGAANYGERHTDES